MQNGFFLYLPNYDFPRKSSIFPMPAEDTPGFSSRDVELLADIDKALWKTQCEMLNRKWRTYPQIREANRFMITTDAADVTITHVYVPIYLEVLKISAGSYYLAVDLGNPGEASRLLNPAGVFGSGVSLHQQQIELMLGFEEKIRQQYSWFNKFQFGILQYDPCYREQARQAESQWRKVDSPVPACQPYTTVELLVSKLQEFSFGDRRISESLAREMVTLMLEEEAGSITDVSVDYLFSKIQKVGL